MKGTKTLLSYLLFIIGLQWKTVYALPGGCNEGEFMCSNKNCILASWKCDNEDDCGDNSDEAGCVYPPHTKCDESTNFKCRNGKCIPKSWTCDKVDDCHDNSDESTMDGPLCLKTDRCARDDFKCNTSGVCIRKAFVCDGYDNCKDGSDEKDCDKRTCNEDEFKCNNNLCISKEWHCDRSDDCNDGSDEVNCSSEACPADKFQCSTSKHCIWKSFQCDGTADCIDGSDEKGCKKTTTTTPAVAKTTSLRTTNASTSKQKLKTQGTTTKAPCYDFQFTCPSNNECIPKHYICDGEKDCLNGGDESKEVCSNNTCADDEFRCGSGKCIDKVDHVCNGVKDCDDESDEKDCPELEVRCSKETFKCKGVDKCVDHTVVCNGKPDCPNGDDEPASCNINECLKDNGGCLHHCTDLVIGFKCDCKYGYELAKDNKTCIDIDECKTPGICPQSCVNYKGSYACECDQGYYLDPIGKRMCKAEAPVPYLVFSNHFDIREISTVESNYNTLIQDARSVVGLALDVKSNMIYWTDNVNKSVCRAPRRSNSDKPSVEVIVSGLEKPEGISVDWVGKKVYWTDSSTNVISVSNLDGSHVKTFIKANIQQQFGAVVVHPEKGYIYWTDSGEKPKIERADLDGKNRITVVDRTHVKRPASIAIDNTLQRLYWSDLTRKRICSCDLDGSNVRVIVDDLSNPYGITVFEEYVYWTDSAEQKMYKANKFNGVGVKDFKESFLSPLDINIFHPLAQKEVAHPCQKENGGCSHLCFISPSASNKFICACPSLMELDSDNKKCIVPAVPTEKTTLTTSTTTTTAGAVVTNPSSKCAGLMCRSTSRCIPTLLICDGKRDCPLNDDEVNCAKPTKKSNEQPTVKLTSDDSTKDSYMLYVYIGIALLIVIAVMIVAVIIYRRKRSRFDLRMIYETHTEVLHSGDKNDKDISEVEVKYVTNPRNTNNSKKNSKNFENINFRVTDESKIPLQMDGDLMVDESASDNSSADIDFDDTKPIIS